MYHNYSIPGEYLVMHYCVHIIITMLLSQIYHPQLVSHIISRCCHHELCVCVCVLFTCTQLPSEGRSDYRAAGRSDFSVRRSSGHPRLGNCRPFIERGREGGRGGGEGGGGRGEDGEGVCFGAGGGEGGGRGEDWRLLGVLVGCGGDPHTTGVSVFSAHAGYVD